MEDQFKFAPVPLELRRMAHELEEIGGGDARIGQVEVAIRVRGIKAPRNNANFNDEERALLEFESVAVKKTGEIVATDPASPQHQRPWMWRPTAAFGPSASNSDVFGAMGERICDWVWSGFNATVAGLGQSGAGKTFTLLGDIDDEWDLGLLPMALRGLFLRRIVDSGRSPPIATSIGIGAWEVCGDKSVDLLSPTWGQEQQQGSGAVGRSGSSGSHSKDHDSGGSVGTYTSVACETAEQALELVAIACRRSQNWHCIDTPSKTHLRSLLNKSHLFFRVCIHNEDTGSVRTLHVVDLAGTPGRWRSDVEDAASPRPASPQRKMQRRDNARALAALSRVIDELATASTSSASPASPASSPPAAAPSPAPKLVSARDTKLTQILGPMLAGNSKTWVIGSVMQAGCHFPETINVLKTCQTAASISTACVRHRDISLERLNFVPFSQVVLEVGLGSSPGRSSKEASTAKHNEATNPTADRTPSRREASTPPQQQLLRQHQAPQPESSAGDQGTRGVLGESGVLDRSRNPTLDSGGVGADPGEERGANPGAKGSSVSSRSNSLIEVSMDETTDSFTSPDKSLEEDSLNNPAATVGQDRNHTRVVVVTEGDSNNTLRGNGEEEDVEAAMDTGGEQESSASSDALTWLEKFKRQRMEVEARESARKQVTHGDPGVTSGRLLPTPPLDEKHLASTSFGLEGMSSMMRGTTSAFRQGRERIRDIEREMEEIAASLTLGRDTERSFPASTTASTADAGSPQNRLATSVGIGEAFRESTGHAVEPISEVQGAVDAPRTPQGGGMEPASRERQEVAASLHFLGGEMALEGYERNWRRAEVGHGRRPGAFDGEELLQRSGATTSGRTDYGGEDEDVDDFPYPTREERDVDPQHMRLEELAAQDVRQLREAEAGSATVSTATPPAPHITSPQRPSDQGPPSSTHVRFDATVLVNEFDETATVLPPSDGSERDMESPRVPPQPEAHPSERNTVPNTGAVTVDALLDAVGDERRGHAQTKQALEDYQQQLLEMSTQYEVKIDSLRLENMNLSEKLRQFEANSPFQEMFSSYEQELERLRSQLKKVTERNCKLELAHEELTHDQSEYKTRNAGLIKKEKLKRLRSYQSRNVELEAQTERLLQQKRQFDVHKRMADASRTKVNDLMKQVQTLTDELMQARLQVAELEAEAQRAHDSADGARKGENALRDERTRLLEELHHTRHRCELLETERLRERTLQKFVDKHARVPAAFDGDELATVGMNTAHTVAPRDRSSEKALHQEMQTLLQKLTVSIRRTQPSMLPTLNKVGKLHADQSVIHHKREQYLVDIVMGLLETSHDERTQKVVLFNIRNMGKKINSELERVGTPKGVTFSPQGETGPETAR